MNALYIALTLWALTLPPFLSIGVNGWRYARMLKLAWPIYIESAFWFVTALLSTWGLGDTIWELNTKGLPPVPLRAWVGFVVGILFIDFLAIGKYVAVRNARTRTREERALVTRAHNAIFRLQSKLNKGTVDVGMAK